MLRTLKQLQIEINLPHIDLKPLCVNLGLMGGLKEVEKISPHPKDIEFFALALKFNMLIWSEEKSFKTQKEVKVLNTEELHKELLDMLSKSAE